MRIGILCFRSYDGYEGASEIRLKEAATELGHEVYLLQILLVAYTPEGNLLYDGQPFPQLDGLISRARVIDQVENRLYVLKLLEEQGFKIINRYEPLVTSKNKWMATEQLRKAGVRTVSTWVVEDEAVAIKVAQGIGYPVVVKAVHGTYGLSVQKAEDEGALKMVLKSFWRPDFIVPLLLQPFISEAKARDHRVFVVGGKVVASMERVAPEGEFRVYSPKAEDAVPVEISKEEAELAVQAAHAVGLDYAGVDVIHTKNGPAILEVNGNAGIMRISRVTGIDVAKAIIEFAVSRFEQGGSRARRE